MKFREAGWWPAVSLSMAVGLFILLAWTHRQELHQVRALLQAGNWWLFSLALLLQLVFFLFQAFMYDQIFRVWKPVPFMEVLRLTLISNCINKLIPTGGVSGLLAFTGQARTTGVPSAVSLLVNLLFYLTDYASFLVVVWGGAVYYMAVHGLSRTQVIAVAWFSLLVLAVLVLVFSALRSYDWLRRTAGRIRPVRLAKAIMNVCSQFDVFRERWPRVIRASWLAFLGGLAMQLVDVLIMYMCFRTVNYSLSLATVTVGFGLASVMAMLSMVPQGIGIYETATTWIFTQIGVSFGVALSVALLYRGVTFWWAMVPGLLGLRGGKKCLP